MVDDQFHVYDTTLRDGAQQEGLNLTVADKLVIARHLDRLGVGFIEGGWPGAIPKDTEFFRRAQTELDLSHATLAAFGSTRKAGVRAADDPQVAALRESRAPVVTLVAKSHDRHVELALRTTLDENLAMIADTVRHLRERASGSSSTPSTSSTATGPTRPTRWSASGPRPRRAPSVIALCDTNGGMMPTELGDVVHAVADGDRGPPRHPLPRRHRLRRRQHPGRRGGGRHPRAGHRQRLRRAGRQREPVQRGGRPAAQEGQASFSRARASAR